MKEVFEMQRWTPKVMYTIRINKFLKNNIILPDFQQPFSKLNWAASVNLFKQFEERLTNFQQIF